ncbi:RAMP superfamily CRISPR-associated protein [Caloranaerobacter sp. DY30410]|uniref:RAMP superfamily CRISPR-associated protein n=1 Tax=Caloranaerobacter sp. DY30410 TaxID=3238305 RepID=UPI003CFEE8B1
MKDVILAMNKPYDFVPFLKCEEYKERGELKGEIQLRIKTLTPIHIFSGRYNVIDNKTIYKTFIRVNGRVIIPGTSFKGCVRSIAEAISYSCLSPSSKLDRRKLVEKRHSKDKRCIICDMFGSMGFKSKIQISDFVMKSGNIDIKPFPPSYSPNSDSPYYLDENGKYKGHKFYKHGLNIQPIQDGIYHEIVMKDAEFVGKILYKNLTEEQVQLLCFSLGLSGDINPKIGFGKSYNLGSIKVLAEDKWVKKAIEYKNMDKKDIKRNIEKLIEILKYKE